MSWKDIKIKQIDEIEKCVGEFQITALDFFENLFEGDTIHYGIFKVKIYERPINELNKFQNLIYTGYTNLKLRDGLGGFEGGLGFGNTIEEALERTICNFIEKLENERKLNGKGFSKEDFIIVEYDDF